MKNKMDKKNQNDTPRTSPYGENDLCKECNSPLVLRPMTPQPFLLTLIFGLSFITLLLITQSKKLAPSILWPWSFAQFILGMFVIRGRIRAKKMVFHCTRCDSPLR